MGSLSHTSQFVGHRSGIQQPTSAGFDPSSVSGLAGWWKADALALSDGAAIATWPDSSTNNRPVAQATGSAQPIYKSSVRNGLPGVRFDGVDDALTRSDSLGITDQPFTYFAVFSESAGTVYNGGIVKLGGANEGAGLGVGNTTLADQGLNVIAIADGVAWINPTLSFAAQTGHVLSMTYSGTTCTIYKDGVAGTPRTVTLNHPFFALFSIGSGDAAGRFFGGDICEVLVFNASLSTTDRQAIESYLKTKWGTP